MAGNFQAKPVTPERRTRWIIIGLLLLVLASGVWFWRSQGDAPKTKGKKPVVEQVISGVVMQADVPIKYTTKGTVSALQTVEVRPQISAMVKAVHIKEGQFVRKGELLFTLDTRTEAANLSKAEAQLAKDRADLRNAERNFERQRELFRQNLFRKPHLIRRRTNSTACVASLRSTRRRRSRAAWHAVSVSCARRLPGAPARLRVFREAWCNRTAQHW